MPDVTPPNLDPTLEASIDSGGSTNRSEPHEGGVPAETVGGSLSYLHQQCLIFLLQLSDARDLGNDGRGTGEDVGDATALLLFCFPYTGP